MLLDLKARGLKVGPNLSVGDGGLGFWAALSEVYPNTKRQRCWVHKTGNILDKMPKSVQSKAKSAIHDMYMAPTKEDALSAYGHFVKTFKDKYPKAVECLTKDEEDLFTFYDFPAAHWIHIRTTNPLNHLCYSKAKDQKDKGMRQSQCNTFYGVQACSGGLKDMEKTPQSQSKFQTLWSRKFQSLSKKFLCFPFLLFDIFFTVTFTIYLNNN